VAAWSGKTKEWASQKKKGEQTDVDGSKIAIQTDANITST
jgi:hypothetical protein